MNAWPTQRKRDFPWLHLSYYLLKALAWISLTSGLIVGLLTLGQTSSNLMPPNMAQLFVVYSVAEALSGTMFFAWCMAGSELIVVALDLRYDTRQTREWIDKANTPEKPTASRSPAK